MERLIALLGLLMFVGCAYLLSVNRQAVRWRPILWGFALQFIFAVLILRIPVGFAVFQFLGTVVTQFLNFSEAGASFVFGENFEDFFFAFKVLPTIIFFAALISLLYHYGLLQRIHKTQNVRGWVGTVCPPTLSHSGFRVLSCPLRQ